MDHPPRTDCQCPDCTTVRLAAKLAHEFEQAFALPAMRRAYEALARMGYQPQLLCMHDRWMGVAWEIIHEELAKN